MFQSVSKAGPSPKIFLTYGTLPTAVNTERPPRSKKPYSTIAGHCWCHTVDLILPSSFVPLVQDALDGSLRSLRYHRAILPLSALVEGELFNAYIKTGIISLFPTSSCTMYSGNATGNVELLSEGRPGIDPLYSLRQGLNFTVLTHVNVYLISLRRPPTRATKTPLRARWPTGKADTGWRKKASEEQILYALGVPCRSTY